MEKKHKSLAQESAGLKRFCIGVELQVFVLLRLSNVSRRKESRDTEKLK